MKKKVAFIGIFTALSLLFSYVEMLIPIFNTNVGLKLGLSNTLILTIIYLYGKKEGIVLFLLKVGLSSLLFGNLFYLIYSLSGGALSIIVMCLLIKYTNFHTITISALSGVSHNLGQILIAYFIIKNSIVLYYFPVLIIFGVICGIITGIITSILIKRLNFLNKL